MKYNCFFFLQLLEQFQKNFGVLGIDLRNWEEEQDTFVVSVEKKIRKDFFAP